VTAAPRRLPCEPGDVLVHVVRLRPGEGGDEGRREVPSFRSSVVATVRQKIVTAGAAGASDHEPQIHYGEGPSDPARARTLPLTTDCSGFCNSLLLPRGAHPIRTGLGYSGEGWTGTLLRHPRARFRAPTRGAAISSCGAAIRAATSRFLLELGEDPLLCSHGHERGPIAIRFSEESRYQPERGGVGCAGVS